MAKNGFFPVTRVPEIGSFISKEMPYFPVMESNESHCGDEIGNPRRKSRCLPAALPQAEAGKCPILKWSQPIELKEFLTSMRIEVSGHTGQSYDACSSCQSSLYARDYRVLGFANITHCRPISRSISSICYLRAPD